jgi:peptidyl-prolyl cis-trans isomerase C
VEHRIVRCADGALEIDLARLALGRLRQAVRQPAYDKARQRAIALLALVKETPERFAELAAAHSDCPSATSGGNLGQVTRGETTPEFEQALLALEPGETSAPVETRYGVHIVRLERRIGGREFPFELVRDRIASYLAERVRRVAIAQYVARLVARGDIAGIDLPRPEDQRVH